MKKLFLLLLLASGVFCNAQALETGTYYKSEINTDSGNYWVYFYVNLSGEVRQINYEKNTYKEFKNYTTISNKNTTTYTWQNDGGIWSENQTFVFTKDTKSQQVYVLLYRVVQNEGDIPWAVQGVGYVETYKVY